VNRKAPPDRDEVTVIRLDTSPEPPPPPSRHPRKHGLLVSSMSFFALLGIASMFAFITVTWPGDTGRYVTGIFVVSIIGFVTSASAAVFTAARNTYAPPTPADATDEDRGPNA
jgi:hypothetical protein